MEKENLEKMVKKAGFNSMNDFVKTNLHYLPESKQRLFYTVIGENYQMRYYNPGD